MKLCEMRCRSTEFTINEGLSGAEKRGRSMVSTKDLDDQDYWHRARLIEGSQADDTSGRWLGLGVD